MSDLIIIGAGGFGLEVAAYAEDMTRAGKAAFTLKGFLDDTKPTSSRHASYPILGKIESAFDTNVAYVIAVGMPEGRKSIAGKLHAGGVRLASIVHPQSYVAASAAIGPGSVVAPFAFVGAEATIGRHCVLNVHVCVGHESRVGDCCVLSPYANLQGGARLGDGVFLGSQACITCVTIGDKARIAAGAVVYNDVPSGTLALGNPAAFAAA